MTKKSIIRLAGWLVALAAILGGAWLAFRPSPVACDITAVRRGPLQVTVDEDGRTRLKDRYVVSAPIAGRAERITLRPGDEVLAYETVLVRIAPAEPALLDVRSRAEAEARVAASSAAVNRAMPEVALAEAQLDHARVQYGRVADAARSGAGTVKETDDALLDLRMREQEHAAARFSLEIARYELEQAKAALVQATGTERNDRILYEVRSPIYGKVLRVMRESAGVVSSGEPLLEVGSLDGLEIEVDFLSEQAVRILPGAAVSIEGWGGAAPLRGRVRLVEPSGFMKVSALGVEEQRVNVIIDFLDPAEARPTLGDNFRVRARITVWESPDAVLVPTGALFRDGVGWAVYVVEARRATLRRIAVGQRAAATAEVLDGLAVGEVVVRFPSDKVREGVRVRPE